MKVGDRVMNVNYQCGIIVGQKHSDHNLYVVQFDNVSHRKVYHSSWLELLDTPLVHNEVTINEED